MRFAVTDRPILTITLNPALDVSTSVASVTPDHKLRCEPPRREPGGGGINVARVTRRLGVPATAVAVVAGATGDRLVALLEAEGVEVEAVAGPGETRESFSVDDRSIARQYRFVMPGPPATAEVLGAVAGAVERRSAGSAPVVVLSGSVPPGVEAGAFARLIDAMAAKPGVDVVIDTSGPALTEALAGRARLIKPSARELAALVGRDLETEAEAVVAAEEVADRSEVGAVLASIGGGGAVLVDRARPTVRLLAPTVHVRSTVGAGDSMVGGVAVGLARGLDLVDAAALGVAAGTAAVMTDGSELCHEEAVTRLLPLVRVEREPPGTTRSAAD